MTNDNQKLTGRASIDRPWLNYYPEMLRDLQIPDCTITEFIKMKNSDWNALALEYYGRTYDWNFIWNRVDAAARSLKVLGFGVGTRIPVFLQTVPEYLILLLAAEKIGAAIICRDDVPDEIAFAIRKSGADVIFAPDYISKAEEEQYLSETPMKRIVKVSPYTYADRDSMPEHIISEIEAHYPEETACGSDNLTWEEFLALGNDYEGEVEAPRDITRPLYCAYTSGSTGISKLVLHSAQSMMGIIFQMSMFYPASEVQQTWLHTILPPALVAVTVTMWLTPLCASKLVMLDPYCNLNDLDLEVMRYQPNFWICIPVFYKVLMKSKRLPEDYSMKHLLLAGSGADTLNNKQIGQIKKFLKDHGCEATFGTGYGQSEGGSTFTIPCPAVPLTDTCCGMPMPAVVLSIFDNETGEEVGYGEIGEICKTGVGNMLGYQDEKMTEEVMRLHSDGKVWVHTGDYGYITEQGVLYVLGRGLQKRYGFENEYLFSLDPESRVVEVPGVDDAFFCNVPDQEHEGYFLPYLFIAPEKGVELDSIRDEIMEVLKPFERPVEMIQIKEREYFHFKTNKKILIADILSRQQA